MTPVKTGARVRRSWLVLLICVGFFGLLYLGRMPDTEVDIQQLFSSPFTDDDLRSLDLTLATVIREFDRHNITYFMNGGTLLGSYRHHDRIPWDDDVDLMVNSSDKDLIWRTLTQLMPDYGLYLSGHIDSRYHWKIYPRRHGRWVPLKPFRWPFVDLLFFRENATHVWNESPWFPDDGYVRSAVFPLRRRPFGAFQIPAPCDLERAVAVNYDATVCATRTYSHVYDLPMLGRSVRVRCSSLAHLYPIVVRQTAGSHRAVTESLVLGNRTLNTIRMLNRC